MNNIYANLTSSYIMTVTSIKKQIKTFSDRQTVKFVSSFFLLISIRLIKQKYKISLLYFETNRKYYINYIYIQWLLLIFFFFSLNTHIHTSSGTDFSIYYIRTLSDGLFRNIYFYSP
jgi:hypothetical protein